MEDVAVKSSATIADAKMSRLISFIVGRVSWRTESERQV
jgi:hypothetical protein